MKWETINGLAKFSERLSLERRRTYDRLVKIFAPDLETSINKVMALNPFLVTGTGRIGTKWLAQLLSLNTDAHVAHEPVYLEQYYHCQAIMETQAARQYIKEFRIREMALRTARIDCSRYGEVNGALKHHVEFLKEFLPTLKLLHLVRDGRNVVSSIMNRKMFTEQDIVYGSLVLPDEFISRDKWMSLDRFSKICWLWVYENEYLRKHIANFVRFEDMIESYDKFHESVLTPLELDVSDDVWRREAGNPKNSTNANIRLSYSSWTRKQKDLFWNICGAEMACYGYMN